MAADASSSALKRVAPNWLTAHRRFRDEAIATVKDDPDSIDLTKKIDTQLPLSKLDELPIVKRRLKLYLVFVVSGIGARSKDEPNNVNIPSYEESRAAVLIGEMRPFSGDDPEEEENEIKQEKEMKAIAKTLEKTKPRELYSSALQEVTERKLQTIFERTQGPNRRALFKKISRMRLRWTLSVGAKPGEVDAKIMGLYEVLQYCLVIHKEGLILYGRGKDEEQRRQGVALIKLAQKCAETLQACMVSLEAAYTRQELMPGLEPSRMAQSLRELDKGYARNAIQETLEELSEVKVQADVLEETEVAQKHGNDLPPSTGEASHKVEAELAKLKLVAAQEVRAQEVVNCDQGSAEDKIC